MDANTTERLLLLEDKEEIRAQIYRYCRAVDRGDKELMRQVYHPDATESHGVFDGPASEFIDLDVDKILPGLELTSHMVSNIVIDLHGDRAQTESYVSVFHRLAPPEGAYDLLMWGRYLDLFERRGGAWRISRRQCVFDGVRRDPASASWDSPWCAMFRPVGRRDRADASYQP